MSALEDELAFQIKACLDEQPVREFKPIDGRQFRVDFCFIDLRIIVEVEGGVWTEKSRHRTGEGYLRDIEKYNEIALDGWMLLRTERGAIESGEAIILIERAINKRKIAS